MSLERFFVCFLRPQMKLNFIPQHGLSVMFIPQKMKERWEEEEREMKQQTKKRSEVIRSRLDRPSGTVVGCLIAQYTLWFKRERKREREKKETFRCFLFNVSFLSLPRSLSFKPLDHRAWRKGGEALRVFNSFFNRGEWGVYHLGRGSVVFGPNPTFHCLYLTLLRMWGPSASNAKFIPSVSMLIVYPEPVTWYDRVVTRAPPFF